MKPYNDYNSYLKSKYGEKVYRIGIDAGYSCPNRDGTKGYGGCLYCNEEGSRSSYINGSISVKEQIRTRIAYLEKGKGIKKYIAYFQAFTNTHASPAALKNIYDEVLPFANIVGISIGTRPDCVDHDKLKLISSYKDRYEVWIEYGLQSMHDRTLKLLNRGHTCADFVNAVKLTKEYNIPVCAHVILGLPGETKEEMVSTARALTELKIEGVKIHVLHVLKGSAMEKLYNEGKITIPDEAAYAGLVCDFLENLSEDIIIQRLTGQGGRRNHIAPMWALDKAGTIKKIEEMLKRRGNTQGAQLKTIS